MVRSLLLVAASSLVLLQQQQHVAGFTTSSPLTQLRQHTSLLATTEEETASLTAVERGVSVDQDGKSNVWAIEPKMEVSDKSSEETTQSALIAGAGLGVAAVAAVAILTNLPDPNQF